MSPFDLLSTMDINDLESPQEKVSELQDWLDEERDKVECSYDGSSLDSSNRVHGFHEGICSWRTVSHHDHNRRPHTIQRAVCMCEQCQRSGSDDLQWTCQEVVKPIRVARRSSENSTFTMDVELVPTACVCRGEPVE